MRRTAIADKNPAAFLHHLTRLQASARDADERVARRDDATRVLVEEYRVPTIHFNRKGARVKPCAIQNVVGSMQVGKGANKIVGQPLTLQPRPGPGGVKLAKVSSLMELMGKLKVMKDAEDRLDDLHWITPRLPEACQSDLIPLGRPTPRDRSLY